jgi:hypothetical protein
MILTVGNGSTQRETCPFATIRTNPTWTGLESNSGFRNERPACNTVSRGTAGSLVNKL